MDDVVSGTFLPAMWAAIGGPADALALVEPGGVPALRSRLAVGDLVRDGVAVASLAGALAAGDAERRVVLDPDRIGTSVTSERHGRLDGAPPDVWAELSGFWPAADGWVRTHANYPHHRRRLLTALGLGDDAERPAVADRIATLPAREVEDRLVADGGVGVAVRSVEEWSTHPQAAALRESPLVVVRPHGPATDHHADPAGGARAPLAGIRVLDLTRVIAGPVATRTLALLGADVLRVDPRGMGEPEWQHLDTGAGKRSTLLDLADADDRERFDALLASADVLVTGYRPGALDRLGLAPATVAARRPDLVVGRVSAWGTTGEWAGRRGFDSIVQAATGIARLEGADGRPGALPAQALDHTAGYLLAAGITRALDRRRTTGAGATVEVALARIAHELLDGSAGREPAPVPGDVTPTVTTVPTAAGLLTYALPALGYRGGPLDWPHPPHRWGQDDAAWA